MPGTRWGPDDIYDHVQQRYGNQLKIYRRAIEEFNPETTDQQSNQSFQKKLRQKI
jgi:hypothetical protein